MMEKPPPPYTPMEAPLASAPIGPPPPYPTSADPYPQIGFVIPGNSSVPSYPTYAVPPTTIVVHQPTPQATVVHFGRHPVLTTCPRCGQYGLTKTTSESGCLVWLICGLLCLFGLWCGCCLIPFCVDSAKNVKHTCVHCRCRLGYYSPL